ncbi:MAG TPA: phage holin family protein [Saprospiraceae bacterium]|nr:phage holin family protein [Saprospiraceae bacterium]
MNDLIKYMDNILMGEWWALMWGVVLGWLVSLVAPVAPFIALSVVLILVDWYLGVKAARRRKEEINSKGYGRTIDKISVYMLLILCAHGIKVVFFDGFEHTYFPYVADFPITYMVAFMICVREFKSIAENAYEITGVDVWRVIAERIESVFDIFKNNKNNGKIDEGSGDDPA